MTGYQTGTNNQLTNDGTWTYTYDAAGNLTKKSKGASAETWYYAYDNVNNLTSAKQEQTDGGTLLIQATYVYDALRERVEKDVWTQAAGLTTVTRFAYDGSNIWADLNGSNQLQTRRLYLDGVDQVFARISSSGTAAWYLTDRMGSTRNLVDASGTLQDTMTYDAFGNILSESNASFSDRYKWTGREFDSETSFQYNRARYYDPKMGRWSSLDPLGFASEDGNLYRYVHNSSPNAIDPWGLVDLPILDNVNNYKPPEGGASIGQMMVDIIPGLNPDLKSAEPQIKFLLQLNEINNILGGATARGPLSAPSSSGFAGVGPARPTSSLKPGGAGSFRFSFSGPPPAIRITAPGPGGPTLGTIGPGMPALPVRPLPQVLINRPVGLAFQGQVTTALRATPAGPMTGTTLRGPYTTIPDGIMPGGQILEVKGGASISYSPQLQAQISIGRGGPGNILVVRPGARVSKPTITAYDHSLAHPTIWIYDPRTGGISPYP